MKTPDYLDLVRAKLNLPSDYALQKPLQISKTQVSKYRNSLESLSEPVCERIAEILDIPAIQILIDMQIEKAKSPKMQSAWKQALEKISSSFDVLMPRRNPRRSLRLAR